MQIKRTIDTAKATYDLLGLTREQFSRLFSAYEYEHFKLHNGFHPENDELLTKFEEMSNKDTLIV
jgi:hypothetical protein